MNIPYSLLPPPSQDPFPFPLFPFLPIYRSGLFTTFLDPKMPQVSLTYSEVYLLSGEKAVKCGGISFSFYLILFYLIFFSVLFFFFWRMVFGFEEA